MLNNQLTDRSGRGGEKGGQKSTRSPTISYVQSSVENTYRQKVNDGNHYISKYQDSSVERNDKENDSDLDEMSLATSDVSVPSPRPDERELTT